MTPKLNLDQAFAANKANIDLLLAVAQTALSTAESLAALNLHTVREVFADNAKNAKTLLGAKTPQEAAALQAQLAQPAVEKAVSYSRSVYEISTGATEELSKLFQAKFSELNSAAQNLAKQSAQQAPFGSDVALAAVNQAVAAANSAFDNLNKFAKQAADATEAGVNTVTNAAVKAASKGRK